MKLFCQIPSSVGMFSLLETSFLFNIPALALYRRPSLHLLIQLACEVGDFAGKRIPFVFKRLFPICHLLRQCSIGLLESSELLPKIIARSRGARMLQGTGETRPSRAEAYREMNNETGRRRNLRD